MIVKCTEIYNPINRESETISNWLTVGKEYVVLTLSVAVLSVENRLYLCCQSDDNLTPIMVEADQFVTVSDKIPSNWAVSLDDTGSLNIAPRRWLRASFWEDYFNGDTSATDDFETELEVMMAEV